MPTSPPDSVHLAFGRRLRRLRERAGFSLDALASKPGVGVSKQALSKYELGRMLPESGVLLGLADALGAKPDDFFLPDTVELSAVEFRKSAKLGAGAQLRLQREAELLIERSLELGRLIGESRPFANPLAGFGAVDCAERAEEAASALRIAWSLGTDAIPDVVGLLESKGALVHSVSLDADFDGLSGFAGTLPVVVLNGTRLDGALDRKRFTAMHEMAHLLLHIPAGVEHKAKENLCHRFAGAFLMPKSAVLAEFGEKRHVIAAAELIDLKSRYGLSMAALMRRALDCGVISPSGYRNWCIRSAARGWRKAEPGSYVGVERESLLRRHLVRALAEGLVSESKATSLAGADLDSLRRWLNEETVAA